MEAHGPPSSDPFPQDPTRWFPDPDAPEEVPVSWTPPLCDPPRPLREDHPGRVVGGLLLVFFGMVLAFTYFGLVLGIILFLLGMVLLLSGLSHPPRERRGPTGAGFVTSSFVLGLLVVASLLGGLGRPCGYEGPTDMGGYSPSYVVGEPQQTTWTFSGATQGFVRSPVNGPAPRALSAATYDSADNVSLMFGGLQGTGSTVLNDSWELGPYGWTVLDPPEAPAPRYGAAIADDPADHSVLLFGGSDGSALFGDTWLFHRGLWTELDLSGLSAPSPRVGAVAVFDPQEGSVVLFGGFGTFGSSPSFGTPLGDTWEFRAGAWHREAIVGPPNPIGRGFAAEGFVPGLGLLLVGGYLRANELGSDGYSYLQGSEPVSDMWRFAQGNWSQRSNYAGISSPLWPMYFLPSGTGAGSWLFSGTEAASFANGNWATYDSQTFSSGGYPTVLSPAAVWWDNRSSQIEAFGGTGEQAISYPQPAASDAAVNYAPVCVGLDFWLVLGMIIFVPVTLILGVQFFRHCRRLALSRAPRGIWRLADEPESARILGTGGLRGPSGDGPESAAHAPVTRVEVRFERLL
ncbi:MAG: hypothetical protein KGJ23_06215 [Euryarchaeota archaeon]|nr:hypothetical protein [Euryarchaeota archaeon]MDE1836194.1 hypothetical protein [Euryarchaeota archaeon]MDE2045443.1 hypothetical protein [Thermoplasmata archaeon]